MSNKLKYSLIATVLVALAILLIGVSSAHSQNQYPEDQREVKPYEFAQFPVSQQFTEGQIYKTVHQGCELFIAVVGKNGQSPSVSITTGRGCK